MRMEGGPPAPGIEAAALTPERAVEEEKGIFERLSGKAKGMAKAFVLATALAAGEGAFEEAWAQPGTKVEDVERKKSPQERAVGLLGTIYNLPDNPNALNEAHNRALKSEVARQLIFKFSLEHKLGFPEAQRISGHVAPDDIRKALKALGEAGEPFADRVFGNNDGKTDEAEMAKFKQATETNAGLRTLLEMLRQFNP